MRKSIQVDRARCGSTTINIIGGLVHERTAAAPAHQRKTVQDRQRWNRDTSLAQPALQEKFAPHVGETVGKHPVQSAKSLPIARLQQSGPDGAESRIER